MDEDLTAPQFRSFAGYKLLQPIASSSRAIIYRAERPGLQAKKPLLLKRYKHSNNDLAKDLQRRCTFLRRISHPSLPTILDHGANGKDSFVVREYIAGLNLRQIQRIYAARAEVFPIEQLASMLSAILEAIDIVQRTSLKNGRVKFSHAELSASHILLDFAGQVHILGFESTRLLQPQHLPVAALDCSLPAALLYQQIRVNRLYADTSHDLIGEKRAALEQDLLPILRSFLQLEAGQKVSQHPGRLALSLKESLALHGFDSISAPEFSKQLQIYAEELGQKDPSAILALPMTPEDAAQGSGDVPNILNFTSDQDLVPPPLDDDEDVTRNVQHPEQKKKEIPAPIDFGASSADKRSQPLPPFEVKEGHQALHESQAQFLGEQFSDILDPFDEQSAEFELKSMPPSQNPFEAADSESLLSSNQAASTNKKFGSIICDFGYLTAETLRKILQQIGEQQPLVDYLQQQGFLDPGQVLDVLGRYYDMRVLSDDEVELLHPDSGLHDFMPSSFVRRFQIVPLRRDEVKLRATVICSSPTVQQQLVEAKILLDVEQLDVMLASPAALEGLIGRVYGEIVANNAPASAEHLAWFGGDK